MPATGPLQPNQRQLDALGWLNKAPLRVIAGPGTGKTATVVDMYLRLIDSGDLDPSQVLLLTFSRNAATELQRRIDERYRRSYAESWVSTFHSFAYRIVRDYSPPTTPRRKLMNGFQEKLLMRFVLDKLIRDDSEEGGSHGLARLYGSQMLAQDVLWLISSLKQEMIRPEEFAAWVEGLEAGDVASPPGTPTTGRAAGELSLAAHGMDAAKLCDLARIYTEYFKAQHDLYLTDFRDVIADAVELLEHHDEVRARLSAKFQYIIVDEYQDVDAAQVRLLDSLTRDHPGFRHLAVVGDGNQSIYSFRGTSPSFLEDNWQFGGETVRLNQNYRSYAPVLDAAERLGASFELSPRDGESTLIADRGQSSWPSVQMRHEVTASDEAAGVARMIGRLTATTEDGGAGYRYDDIAIVLRSVRRTGREFEDALQAAGIPHDVGVSPNFAASDIVRFAVCALAALADPGNDEHLVNVIESPFCGVPTPDARRLLAEALRRRNMQRESLKEKSLRTVLNHVCYLMAAEDPDRWRLPWGRIEKAVEEDDDPISLAVEPAPPPSPETEAQVERQETIADQIDRESERDDPLRPETTPHAFYQLLSDEAKDAIHRFCGRWGILRSVAGHIPVDALLYRIFQDLDVMRNLMSAAARDSSFETGPILGPLRMLMKAVREYVAFQEPLLQREPTLTEVLESLEPALREYVDELEPEEGTGSVRIMTVHAAKGLEFPVVFVPGMAAGRFPVTPRPRTPLLSEPESAWLAGRLRESGWTGADGASPLPWVLDQDEFLKEEARLAYVAGTRARDLVVYSWADEYADDQTAQPSAFLQPLANAAGLNMEQLAAASAFTDRSELHRPPSFHDPRASIDEAEAEAFFDWKPWEGAPLQPALDLHLSSSSVTSFLACPRKFYYSKLLDIRADAGVAAARGSAFHRAMQLFHDPATERRWRENGEDAEVVYRECCDQALSSYLALVDGLLEKRQEEQLLRKLFANYLHERDRWPDLETIATEAQFQWNVDGQVVLGYIDRIISTGAGVHIVDYKTGSDKTRSAIEAQLGMKPDESPPTDLQLLIYFFALQEGAELRNHGEAVPNQHDVAAIWLWYPKRVLTQGGPRIRKIGLGEGSSGLGGKVDFIDIAAERTELRSMVAQTFEDARAGEYAAEPKHDQYTCTSTWGTGCEHAWMCPGRVTEPAGYEADG